MEHFLLHDVPDMLGMQDTINHLRVVINSLYIYDCESTHVVTTHFLHTILRMLHLCSHDTVAFFFTHDREAILRRCSKHNVERICTYVRNKRHVLLRARSEEIDTIMPLRNDTLQWILDTLIPILLPNGSQ